MLKQIVPQVELEVKCDVEGCHEDVFHDDLCLFHLVEEETAAWDNEDAEREMVLECVGHVFGEVR